MATKLLNRGSLFVVVRHDISKGFNSGIAVGGFSELSDADDYKGMSEQQWKERVGDLDGVEFEIQLTTYYGK